MNRATLVTAFALWACSQVSPVFPKTEAAGSSANGAQADRAGAARQPGPSATSASFCTPAETVVFSCRVGAKLVSVCASSEVAVGKGSVQYRFGNPDAAGPLELTVPDPAAPPSMAATADTLSFSGGGGAWMRFRRGDYAYVVYTGIGKWGPRGRTEERQGVAVERAGKLVSNLACTSAPVSELGPEWFEKAGLRSNDEDFDIPVTARRKK